MQKPCTIIAELGINHNGNLDLAKQMLSAAATAGADIVKFHTYKAEEVMTAETPLADYMKKGEIANNFLDMARRFELDNQAMIELQAEAEQLGVEFLSSPFDVPSVAELTALGVKQLKIPSGELVNPLLLDAVAATGLPLIVSTGMADLAEVRWAMDRLATKNSGPVTLLHCLSQYPAEYEFVNLRAITTLRETFHCPVGFSDHTPGIEIAVAAVALGACVIEKHFTLDHSLPGPDQAASLEPTAFTSMVRSIRHLERAMGTGEKKPAPPEIDNRAIVRKSLVYTADLPVGTVLDPTMLTAKRPGTGIPAIDLEKYIGRRLNRECKKDRLVEDEDIE